MPPFQAACPSNQIAFDFMSESDVTQPRAGAVAAAAFAPAGPARGFVPVVAGVSALGILILAIASSGAGTPLLLTILSTLAMFGVFFLFGLMAGHIRVGERLEGADFARAIPEGLDRGVLVTRRDGTPLYTNKMLEEFTGRTASGEAASLDAAFGSDGAAREALFRLTRAAERGDRHREDLRLPAAGGGVTRTLAIETAPFDMGMRRETGPLSLWTVADVTDDRLREAAARQALHDALGHYESAPVGLIAAGRDGTIRHMNATLTRWLGYQTGARTQRVLRLADVLSADAVELLEGAWREGAPDLVTLEIDATREDGRLLPVQLVARSGRDGSRLLALMNRELEAGIAHTGGAGEERFDRFFQSAPFGIASVSADGRIASANSAFARLMLDASSGLNKPAAEVLCRTADKLTRSSVEDSLKQVLAGRASPQPIEITVGGEREQVRRVFLSPLATFGNSREAAMLYVIDATEQKALEAQYAQSSKMEAVGKLAGGIAHDFNNVLTAIIGFSDLLLQTHRTSDPAFKDIKNIQSSAYRAAGMVRQLLSFSRRQTLQAESLQLDEVLAENASMLRTSVGEKIALKIQPSRDLWYVKVDKTEFDRVILNLSVNAGDAMPGGGSLTVRTANVTERESQKLGLDGMPIGEYVMVEVSDTGSGMPPDVIAKIFEPFFTTKDVGKGTGLGLSTVYGIVKQSGGFIYVTSEVGKGTAFRVYLPRYIPDIDDTVVAVKEKKKDRPADLTGTGRVLLVEDEDVVRSFAVRALKRQGYEVLEASTGVEALEIMSENEGRIDIVVSDVVMPEMDGPTLFKELRRRNPTIKVIFVSGYPNEAFRETLGTEDFAFLPKPFSLPQLAAKVKEELAK